MKVLYEIQDMLEDELKKISKKDDITAMDLENIYKMVDIVKDVTTIDAMKKSEQGGYSQDYSRNSYDGSYRSYGRGSYNSYDGRRGRDGDSDGRYSEEGSYRRGGGRGRYSRDGSYEGSYDGSYDSSYEGYSGHGKEQMVERLTEMMRNARNEEERDSYRKALEQLQR